MALNINGTTGISGVDGSASAPALQGTDSNTGINFASDTVNINTGGTTRATINSAGNLGLGITSPTAASGETTLNIYANEYPELHLTSNVTGTAATDGTIISLNNDNSTIIRNQENSYIRFDTNGSTERMRIGSDGVITTYNAPYAYLQSNSTSTSSLTLKKSASGADNIDFLQCRRSGNSLKMQVQGSGDVNNANNTYGSVSDLKLKENIVDANSQWNDIKAVKVRNFNFKDDSAKIKMLGVVAQEIEIISSGLVSESIDRNPETGEDLGTKTKAVKYSILYMKAIKCLQEAQARIETLETEKTKLQTDLTALTARVTALEAG
jgi:hypothetical protein